MVADQLSMFDLFPSLVDPPELGACMKTCAHAELTITRFGPRCSYPSKQPGDSWDIFYERVIDNISHVYCGLYEEGNEQ